MIIGRWSRAIPMLCLGASLSLSGCDPGDQTTEPSKGEVIVEEATLVQREKCWVEGTVRNTGDERLTALGFKAFDRNGNEIGFTFGLMVLKEKQRRTFSFAFQRKGKELGEHITDCREIVRFEL